MSMRLRQALQDSDLVKEKDLGDGLFAYNFTRDAFRRGNWDSTSIAARGMFMDSSGTIVGRGFEKFFNIGERPESQREVVRETFTYPVVAQYKSNGYLGLIFSIDGAEVKVFSKSGPTDYAENASRILDETLRRAGCDRSVLASMLFDYGVTLAAEVIDPEHDPHLVDEGGPKIVALAAIGNGERFRTDSEALATIACLIGATTPETLGVARDADEMDALIDEMESLDCEGAVLVDARGKRVKVKSGAYNAWKDARGVLERTLTLHRRSGETVEIAKCGRGPRTDRGREILAALTERGITSSDDLDQYLLDGIAGNKALDMIALRHLVEG